MTGELEIIYVILALQAIGMLISVSVYNYKRLKIEEVRSTALQQQRDNLAAYYDQRLSIEKAKLDVERAKLEARRNGP
jgi:hypothetical protein